MLPLLLAPESLSTGAPAAEIAAAEAAAPPKDEELPPAPIDRLRYGFGVFGAVPYLTTTPSGLYGGSLTGFRAEAHGFAGYFAYDLTLEGRIGGGYGGAATRDRAGGGLGVRLPIARPLSIDLRALVDARYAAYGIARGRTDRFGRLLAPGGALSVIVHGGGSAGEGPVISVGPVVGLGTFAARMSDRELGLPPSLAYGGRLRAAGVGKYLALSWLRLPGERGVDELEAAGCLGVGYALCAEVDHSRGVDATGFAATRFLLSFGVGLAGTVN